MNMKTEELRRDLLSICEIMLAHVIPHDEHLLSSREKTTRHFFEAVRSAISGGPLKESLVYKGIRPGDEDGFIVEIYIHGMTAQQEPSTTYQCKGREELVEVLLRLYDELPEIYQTKPRDGGSGKDSYDVKILTRHRASPWPWTSTY
jgi:hypothetical protein